MSQNWLSAALLFALKNILITSPHEACSVLQITSRVLDLMVRVSSTTSEEGARCSVLLFTLTSDACALNTSSRHSAAVAVAVAAAYQRSPKQDASTTTTSTVGAVHESKSVFSSPHTCLISEKSGPLSLRSVVITRAPLLSDCTSINTYEHAQRVQACVPTSGSMIMPQIVTETLLSVSKSNAWQSQ
eukprot:21256-Heterococcus_DN1.PRE.3